MLKISALVKDIDSPMGKYLICRAGPEDPWRLPGGAARTNEPPQDAVRRLMREQLGLEVQVGKMQLHARRKLQDAFVVCEYYDAVNLWGGKPAAGVYREFRWARPEELKNFAFEDYDARFMSKFLPWITADGSEIPGTKMF